MSTFCAYLDLGEEHEESALKPSALQDNGVLTYLIRINGCAQSSVMAVADQLWLLNANRATPGK